MDTDLPVQKQDCSGQHQGPLDIACDANMDPTEFPTGDWVKGSRATVTSLPRGSAACCAEGAGGVQIQKVVDCEVGSVSSEGKIVNVDVVNMCPTSPHKAVRCTI